jgi:phosphopantothenoylcysteine synthetase/decarboxylase
VKTPGRIWNTFCNNYAANEIELTMPTKKTNLKIKNFNILLGVSGGIAAYKVVDLAPPVPESRR